MSIFVDTGVLVAFVNAADAHHDEAIDILGAIGRRRWGNAFTSDYVMDEAVTLAFRRTKRPDLAVHLGRLILGTAKPGRLLGILYVTPRLFLRSWARFTRLAARGLSFTDCTSLEFIRVEGLGSIASFDRDFDGFVPRISGAEDAL
ncbi:MAG: type II toxin-antitoxin system VapC family toxin [Methanobacteriota archaeon]